MRIAADHSDPSRDALSTSQNPRPRRFVWSEHLSPSQVAERQTLDLLASYRLELAVAVRPGQQMQVPQLLDAAAGRGVPIHLWPMLRNEDGRWLSEHNARRFAEFVHSVLDVVGDPSPAFVLDLEPPIETMRQWIRHPSRILAATRRGPARPGNVRDVVNLMQRRGAALWAAVVPMLLADRTDKGGWHKALGTPVDPTEFSRLSAMVYSSIALGYGRGLLRRSDARALLFETARASVRRWGSRASASVGAVGPGALGDERPYREPQELAEDVALVRAAGVEDIGLFELRGVLRRPPAQRWLDALCHTEPAHRIPVRSRRALAAVGLALGLGRVFQSKGDSTSRR